MRILTVIQARLGSSRLAGKVLLPLQESTVLGRMMDRVVRAEHVGPVVIAITDLPEDDSLFDYCQTKGWVTFRGHPTDCLARHYEAAKAFSASAIAKIPSDCPLIDPKIIDRVYERFLGSNLDYVSNLHPQSYPDGNDVEVFSFKALETAYIEAKRPIEREHTTPYFWENPDKFTLGNVTWERGIDLSQTHRWTLDYQEDYALIQAIDGALRARTASLVNDGSRHDNSTEYGVDEIVQFLEKNPQVRALNASRIGDSWYQRHQDELRPENRVK